VPDIKLRSNNTPGETPTGLEPGELAINTNDGTLFIGDAEGSSVKIVGTAGKYPANNVSINGGSINNTAIQTSPSVAATNLQVAGGETLTGVTSDLSSTSNSTVATSEAVQNYVNSASGALKNIYTFTSPGTYTKSGSDVTQLKVIVVGGGGGGRGYGESGGAGGYGERWIDATSISTESVTIGGGGGGGVYFGNSPGGGTTSFGGYVSASGGSGANNQGSHIGGQGGIGSDGNLNFWGGGGVGHHNCHTASYHNPGHGGKSFFGGGQAGQHYTPRTSAEAAPGAGGTGSNWYNNGANNYDRGHDGRGGICVVYEYK